MQTTTHAAAKPAKSLTAAAFALSPTHKKYSKNHQAALSQCRRLGAYLHALGHCGYELDALCPAGSSAASAAPGEDWRRLHVLLKEAVRGASKKFVEPANIEFLKTHHGVKSALRAVLLVRGREPGARYEYVIVLVNGPLPIEEILHVLAHTKPLKAVNGSTVKLKLLRELRSLFRRPPTITHQLEAVATLKGRALESDAPFTAIALAGPHPADLERHQTTPHPAEPLLFLAGAELGACSARLNANAAGSPVATADTHYQRPRAHLAAKVPELILRTKGMADRLKSLPPPAAKIDGPLTADFLRTELPKRFKTLAAALLSTAVLSGCSAMIGLDAKDDFSCPAAQGVPCRSLSTVYELTKSEALPHQVHPADFAAPVLEVPEIPAPRPESAESAKAAASAPKADTPVASGAGTTNAVSEEIRKDESAAAAGSAQTEASGAARAAQRTAAAQPAAGEAPAAPITAHRTAGPEAVVFDPRSAATADFASPVRLPEEIRRVLLAPWTDDEGDLHEGHFLYLEIRRAHWLTARRPAADAPAVTQLSFGPVSATPEAPCPGAAARVGSSAAAAPQAPEAPLTGFTSAEDLRRLRADYEAKIRAVLPAAGAK